MTDHPTERRRLAAIMFTDMVGFSALAQRDEGLALDLLEEQRTLLRTAFLKHQGTEIKTMGASNLALTNYLEWIIKDAKTQFRLNWLGFRCIRCTPGTKFNHCRHSYDIKSW